MTERTTTERTIFLTALEITDQSNRVAYLDEACAGDEKLRSQVEGLLSSHERSSQFLETPATAENLTSEKTLVSGAPAEDGDDLELSAAAAAETELRTYLQPSTRPGWLGRLSHYEIESILGTGAFGIVVKAFDEKLQRVVAIKIMNPDLATTSPPRKRFLREARTAAAVRHENIVGIYAVEEEPLPFLVMEYIPGITLQQKLDLNGPLELSEILKIGQQVAAGLTAAHAANLIHRDIKPSNILLEGGIENRAKISDFGLARAVDDASMTQSGLIAGTPLYMAPEQARGEVLDHRADLFSMGSVLYQMASGRPPFRAANTIAVLKRVCEDTPRPIQDIIPEIPDWLCMIISRLLEKKPSDRIQAAKELTDLLARCQSELQLGSEPRCLQQLCSSPASKTSSIAATRKRNSRVSTVVKVFSMLLFLGAAAWLWPALVLLATRQASFENLTRDGDTKIEFYSNGQLIRTQTGFGGLELPAGEYELRVSHPDEDLRVFNSVVMRRNWLRKYEQVTLSSLPQALRLKAGDRVEFIVGYSRISDSLVTKPYTRGHIALQPATKDTRVEFRSIEVQKLHSDGTVASAAPFAWPADGPAPAIAPFDVEQAKAHQAAWSDHLGIPVELDVKTVTKFVLIPPGEFVMGSAEPDVESLTRELKQAGASSFHQFVARSSVPSHFVRLTQPYYMATHEVTVGAYRQFIDETHYIPTAEQLNANRPPWTESAKGENAEQRAVIGVSWEDAAAYCEWRSQRDGVTYELPTEAQWEYACRAGTTSLWSFGDDVTRLGEYAVCMQPSFWPSEVVGTKKPNPFGLFDMYGNAEEWCCDWHSSGFYARSPVNDPVMLENPGDPSSGRVTRGGCRQSMAWWTRSATRPWDFPATPTNPKGFRIVITGDLKKAVQTTEPAGRPPAQPEQNSDDLSAEENAVSEAS